MSQSSISEATAKARVVVHRLAEHRPLKISRALPDRLWMNHQLKGLGLSVRAANETGWVVHNCEQTEIIWNGGSHPHDLRVLSPSASTRGSAESTFGQGIVTWALPFVLQLAHGWRVRLRGPVNAHKDGIFAIEQSLDGDDCRSGLSISWKVTKIGQAIRFLTDEPIAMILPEAPILPGDLSLSIQNSEARPDGLELAPASREVIAGQSTPGRSSLIIGMPHLKSDEQCGDSPVIFPDNLEKPPRMEVTARAHRLETGNELPRLDKPTDSRLAAPPIIIEENFFDRATDLRTGFERFLSLSPGSEPNSGGLAYSYSANAYQLLTASAEQVFGPDLTFGLLARLRAWGEEHLGICHASTPRVQVYVGSSYRSLAREAGNVHWHYILGLTLERKRTRKIRILLDRASPDGRRVLDIDRIFQIAPYFNRLLIHPATSAYGITPKTGSMDPLQGMAFLDGYLW